LPHIILRVDPGSLPEYSVVWESFYVINYLITTQRGPPTSRHNRDDLIYASDQLPVAFLSSAITRDKLNSATQIASLCPATRQSDEGVVHRTDRTAMNNISQIQHIQRQHRRRRQQHLYSVRFIFRHLQINSCDSFILLRRYLI